MDYSVMQYISWQPDLCNGRLSTPQLSTGHVNPFFSKKKEQEKKEEK